MMTDIIEIIMEIENDTGMGGRVDLKYWIDKYPAHREEILEYATLKLFEPYLDVEPVDDPLYAKFALRSAQILNDALKTVPKQETTEDSSLFKLIRMKNKRPENVAKSLRVGFSLLTKLDHQLLDFNSIPSRFWKALASEINESVETLKFSIQGNRFFSSQEVGAFLIPPVRLQYFSLTMPKKQSPISFASAILDSEDMTEEDKAYWLEIDSSNTPAKEDE